MEREVCRWEIWSKMRLEGREDRRGRGMKGDQSMKGGLK